MPLAVSSNTLLNERGLPGWASLFARFILSLAAIGAGAGFGSRAKAIARVLC